MQDCAGCICLSDEPWGTVDEGKALETTDPPTVPNTTKMQTDSGGEQVPAAADDDTCTSQSPTCNKLDAEAGTVTIGGERASITVEAPGEHFQSQRTFFAAPFACFLLAMGTIMFIILGCGNAGFCMTNGIVVFAITGSVDIAVTITENLEAEQPHNVPDLHHILVKRGAGWLTIGALYGLSLVLWYNTYDSNRAGEVWQPEAILYTAVGYSCGLVLAGGMMLQIHRDNPANIWRLYILIYGGFLLRDIGDCSPYAFLSTMGTVLLVLGNTVGHYVVVIHLDSKAEPSDIKNGYVYLCATLPSFVIYVGLTAMSSPRIPPLALPAVLVLGQKVALKAIIPIAKRCWGDDDRKLWTYVIPTFLLGFELPACLLFLQSSLTNSSFWYLLIFQESNSVLKNTGYYDQFYLFIRQTVGRPVSDDARDAMDEKRMILAPCDNIAEIASPVVIGIAVAFSGLFDSFGLDRTTFLAETGLFDGWQMGQNNRSRGEVPIILLVVLAFRLIFCWIEITLRSFKHRKKKLVVNSFASAIAETTAGAIKKRRSSMSVLYDRIAHSQNAPVHMKYAAGIWFASGAIIFVLIAANLGRRRALVLLSSSSSPTPAPTLLPAMF